VYERVDAGGFGRMIRFLLLQNRQGKTRTAKYYVPMDDDEKHQLEFEVHRLVVNRDPKFTNFAEFRTHKIIYRRYAGLFFSLCVDVNDNELALLEAIHLFVEVLDHYFSNVCELDLVFNFHKVYQVIDEFILAGEIQETSKKQIMERLYELEKIMEEPRGTPPAQTPLS
jgi:AP-2 complex subunit sigma-1